ncbi:MAG: hypothetical protein MJ176_00695 [Treponema sp.]|nr:hypothetical protein [Treponema sp.]
MKRVNILFQSDNNFAFMVGVGLTSLLENASKDVFYDIYILQLNYSDENKQKFESLKEKYSEINFKLTFIDSRPLEKIFVDLGVEAHRGSYVTYFKLLVARLFENTDVEKIIHIGADCLITGSLEELADFDFDGKPFAMNWTEKGRERYYPHKGGWTCIAEMIYFNLPVWREMKCEERIVRHIKEIGAIYGSKDQGIMNVEFEFEYAQLPLKFNVYSFAIHFSKRNLIRYHNAPILSKNEIFDAIQKPEIIHYARSFLYRPCEENDLFFKQESDLWWKYCDNSPWKGIKRLGGQPKLGSKEKLFRWLYTHTPMWFNDWLYIYTRRLFGWLLWLTHLPRRPGKIGKL